ncbi:MAG: PqqD family protein, partial [Blastocatellia bacterium]
MITSKQRFVTKEQASFTELIDHQESILLDLESLHYYSLNAAATLLWKHLRAGSANAVTELSQQLATAFQLAPSTAELDTRQFLTELLHHQLITGTEETVTSISSFAFPTAEDLPSYEPPAVKTSNAVLEMNLAGTS